MSVSTSRGGCRCLVLAVALLQWACLVPERTCAQFPAIELSSLSQPAIQRGTSVEQQLLGANLENLDQFLISSTDGVVIKQAVPEPADGSTLSQPSLKISIPRDHVTGLFQTRLAGRFGVSNPRPLLITSSPVIPVQSVDHSEPALALAIREGTIYHFVPQPRQKTYFRMSLDAGETLHCTAYARQLDSQTIPNLILIGPNLVELRRSRGIASWPAEISYTIRESGDYYLIAHDFLYRGGHGFSCLMEAAVDPVAGDSNQHAPDPGSQAHQLELDHLLRPTFREISPDAHYSRPESILCVASVEHEAQNVEPNDMPVAPFSLQGDLQSGAFSIDFFASSDKTLWLEVHSSSADQLTDPRLLLYKLEAVKATESQTAELLKQQNRLLENDERPSQGGPDMRLRFRDPYVSWTPPEDGNYRLVIADQQRGKRPADSVSFRLFVREASPGFDLLAFHEYPNSNRQVARPRGVNLMRGDKISVRVMAVRRDGYREAIEVVAENLPESLVSQPAVIPANATEASLIVESRSQSTDWLGELKITGRPLDSEFSYVREAYAATVSLAASPSRNAIATRRTDRLYVASNAVDQAPLSFQAGGEAILEVAQGEKLSIPIQVQRGPEANVACVLRARDLPPKAKLADLSIAADKQQGEAELVVARDTPPGTYTIWFQAEARLKWRKNPQALDAAEADLEELQKQAEQVKTPAEKSSAQRRIEQLEKRIALLRKSSAPQDLTTWIPSNLIRVQILPLYKVQP